MRAVSSALILSILASCSSADPHPQATPEVAIPAGRQTFDDSPVPSRADWLKRVLEVPDKEIDLVEAATVLASHRLAVPRLASAIPRFLVPLVEKARARLGPSATPDEKIDALNAEVLPAIRRASGTELRWLHETLGAEEGGCAVNSVLYLIAGDLIGLTLEPVEIPTHMFVCHRSSDRRRNIETTDRGQHWTAEEYRQFLLKDPTALNVLPEVGEALDRAIAPCTRRQFVSALMCQAGAKSGKGVPPEDLEWAARVAPTFYVPMKQLESYYAVRDDYAKWEDFASKAVALAPYVPGLYCVRASCRMIRGKLGLAIEDIDAALELAPNAARFHFIKGVILVQSGRSQEAVGSYSRAVEGAPRSAEYLDFRAMAYERSKMYAEAIEDCTKAIALEPTKAGYLERRSRLWAMVGDGEKYEADRKKAKALAERP